MSIQGSVNQLFTIGGSFAGMYGLLHPEIAQARQIIHDLKGAKTAGKLSEGYFINWKILLITKRIQVFYKKYLI